MLEFNKKIQEQFFKMCSYGNLFRVELSGQDIWNLYMNSFEKDPIFRDPNSSTHNCNICNNFLRRYGNIVAIDENYNTVSIFNIEIEGEFKPVAGELKKAITNSPITNVFFETFIELNSLPYESCSKTSSVFQLGTSKNIKRYTKEEAEKFGVVKPEEMKTFNHLHLFLPKDFVDTSGSSVESIMGSFRDSKNVFQRGMETISLDTLSLVKDLIAQGSLLDGTSHLFKIEAILPLKKSYDSLEASKRDNWCWVNSYKLPIAKFRNELIGVLCSELSEGEELNKACQSWNKRVDPTNYMKATAPITKKQIEEAKKFVEENGYEESFNRRFATLEDIKVSEILHSNVGSGTIKAVSIFDTVKSTSTRHKRSEFEGLEEVSIEKFMSDILPSCSSIEALLLNSHKGNLVSLTTANNPNSKPIFKWDNNYSWTFNGNLAGKSMIKEAVKDRGGKVDGCLNIRLHFPNSTSDYDLHIIEPTSNHIYYGNRRQKHSSSGMLDLDAQGADGSFPPDKRVENIIYTNKARMPKGRYKLYINNYRQASGHGFTLEIEIGGETTTFNYTKSIPSGYNLSICTIDFNGEDFTINPLIEVGESMSKEIYGMKTNEFHKVNLVCLSPNHWGDSKIGNLHYLFMLDGCKTPTSIRSFHNENLISDLLEHRKVMEVLGATNMLEPKPEQLSGLGFNSTVREELIVKLQGTHKRMLKIKF